MRVQAVVGLCLLPLDSEAGQSRVKMAVVARCFPLLYNVVTDTRAHSALDSVGAGVIFWR